MPVLPGRWARTAMEGAEAVVTAEAEIETLTAAVRAGLGRVQEAAERGFLKAPGILGYTGWDTQVVVALPPAVAALVLADVAARRTLLDEALGWEHAPVEEGRRYYPCQVEADPPGLCDCKRDERILAVLKCLAEPYREKP